MSYTGTMVYYPASTVFDAVRDVLASRFDSAALTAGADAITLAFDDRKVIRIVRDAASHVPTEAKEHAASADAGARAALERAAYRVEIAPADPSADPDDMYNELLFVFETLREMPEAVGLDPFDGEIYFTATKVAAKRAASVRAAPNKAAPKQAATKKSASKRSTTKKAGPKQAATKKSAKRSTPKKAAPNKAVKITPKKSTR